METDWKAFFNQHAVDYNENCFTQNTEEEVRFIIEELQIPEGASILDMGCGTGRHSIQLAKRGYKVTGVDLSDGMLSQARGAALQAGVLLRFEQGDAATYSTDVKFDAAICICEGSFGLLGAEDDAIDRDLTILRNIHAALKHDAPFMLTALNAMRPIRTAGKKEQGIEFDLNTQVEHGEMTITGKNTTASILTRERLFTPAELQLMFRLAGFSIDHIGGGTAGNWGKRPLDPDEMEIMVLSRRVAK